MEINRFSTEFTEVIGGVLASASNHEVQVLVHLYTHPAQRPAQLVAVTGLTRPSVATLVGRLERAGLVERSLGKDDRRTTLASLTIRGRRRMRQLDAELDALFVRQRERMGNILDLLGCDRTALVPARTADDTALVLTGRLSVVGAAMERSIGELCEVMHRRQRVGLSALLALGSARAGELAEVLGLSSGGLTYLIDHLVADGLAVRSHGSPGDRRAVVIELSDAGRDAARTIAAAVAEHAGEFCATIRVMQMPRPAAPV